MGLILEFVGLPGTGKTTLARQTQLALVKHGLRVELDLVDEWRASRMGDSARGAIPRLRDVHAREALHMAKTLRGSLGLVFPGKKSSLEVVRTLAYTAMVNRRFADWRNSDHVHISDQGVIQALWSLAMRSSTPAYSVVDQLADFMILPDRALELRAPHPSLFRRLSERTTLPRSLRSFRGNLPAGLAKGESVMMEVRQALAHTPVHWMEFETGDIKSNDVVCASIVTELLRE